MNELVISDFVKQDPFLPGLVAMFSGMLAASLPADSVFIVLVIIVILKKKPRKKKHICHKTKFSELSIVTFPQSVDLITGDFHLRP